MANMSYCRFTNTRQDLRDCQDHIDDDDLSPEERKERKKLIKLCIEIANDYSDPDTGEIYIDD